MRALIVLLHRWVGLTIAGFLVMSGLTGAVISWDHELDHLLNARLTKVTSRGQPISSLELAHQIEARDPRAKVTFIPFAVEVGEALNFGVDPRVDPATGKLYELGYNEVFIDPVTGVELGKRAWGAGWPITKENFVSFLYVLHYSLQIPEMWGIDDWGEWLLGGIAILWTLDCFAGFYLTLPLARRRSAGAQAVEDIATDLSVATARSWWHRWLPAWKVRWHGGSTKLNFDLHRAFSLWTWALLFILAFTAFSMNLYDEVFYPVISKISKVTPSPFDQREETDRLKPIDPQLDYGVIIARAEFEAQRRGWKEPLGDIFYAQNFGIYSIRFFQPGGDHGAAGVGPPVLFYDGNNGTFLGDQIPWQGTAADIFVQAQFPLHSGRILGLPGRILISVMGIVVAMLSITGVIIWWRKRESRMIRKV